MDKKTFLNHVYSQSEEDYGLIPPPTDPQYALSCLCDYLLGEDWYTVMPMSQGQANTEIVCAIMDKYPQKKRRKKWQRRK